LRGQRRNKGCFGKPLIVDKTPARKVRASSLGGVMMTTLRRRLRERKAIELKLIDEGVKQ